MATTTLVVPVNAPGNLDYVTNFVCIIYKQSTGPIYTQLGSTSNGANWNCPQTTFVATDRVQINTSIWYDDMDYNPQQSVVSAFTAALGTTILNAATWGNMPQYDGSSAYPATTVTNIVYGVVDSTAPVLSGTLLAVPGNAQATISGPTASDANGIAKWQYRIGTGSWVDIASSANTTMPTKVVTGLTNGTQYSFTVRALDAAGNASTASSAATVTPAVPDTTAPVVTGLLSATAGNAQAVLSGPTATDAVGISKWQWRQGTGAWTDISNSATTTMPAVTVTNLTNDIEYSFTVRALDAAGNISNTSNVDVVTPKVPAEILVDTLRAAPPSIIDRLHFRALDSNFLPTAIVDAYESMIWTERYSDVGDFELHGHLNEQLLSVIKDNAYIFNSVSSGLMVIEKHTIEYDAEDGNIITITGRSMDSVLDRRVLDKAYTFLNATDRRISQIIYKLITDSFCNVNDADRYWDLLEVIDSTSASSISLPVDVGMQFSIGDNLLSLVTDLCSSFNLGIKCEFSVADNVVKFIIYEGDDLSVQGPNMLIFSDLYSNLLTGKNSLNQDAEKNAALVVGSIEDPTTKLPIYPETISPGNFTGLNRREIFIRTDLTDVVYLPNDTERAMTEAEYRAALIQTGTKELNKPEYRPFRDYDGEILEVLGCRYMDNFNLGDIVGFWLPNFQFTTARLESVTFSDDSTNGKTLLPKFQHNI